MANIQQTNEGVSVQFTKNKKFLGSKSSPGINFTVNNAPDVLLALSANNPFPDREIAIGVVSAKASAGDKDIQFGKGAKQASFSGSASAFSGIGVYPDPRRLLRSLDLGDDISPGLHLPQDSASNYLMLRWGYNLKAAGKGGIIFGGAGSANLGVDAKSEGVMAVIRRLPKTTGAASAVAETVESWLLPLQIDSPEALPPGTWIIADVDSSISVGADVQFGFDFNWVKEAQAAGLSGDIGLRLQLGAKAAASFQAGGRFAVVVSRDSSLETDKKIRIRLFKQRRKGWNFALDAQAAVQGNFEDFLPAQFDDFVKAVFRTHGSQILKDLEIIDQWTNPNQDLGEMLAGLSSKYFKKFVQDTTGVDPEKTFDLAKGKLQDLLGKWNDLDHQLASMIWKQLEQKTDIEKIIAINNKLKDANEENAKAFIQEQIADIKFFQKPEGQFLLALLPDEHVLSMLTNSEAFQKVQAISKKVSAVLDGGTVMETLVKLQDNINKRLNLDKLEQVVTETDFNELDEWLKVKLSNFIDDKLKLSRIAEIRQTIHTIVGKRGEFYEKAKQALNREYAFGFNAAFQKNTTSEALIDMSFDAGKGNVNPLIRQALLGQFDKILTQKRPGVTLHAASLTHGVRLQSHITLNLPFFKGSSTHLNTCLTKMDAIDEEDGRIFLYDVKAEDIVVRKNKQVSALSIGGTFRTEANTVQVHNPNALSYAYSFQQLQKNTSRAELQYQLKPYIDAYLPMTFTPTSEGATVAGLDAWITDLEQQVELLEPNGAGNLGQTLMYLELTLPARIASAWTLAPDDKRHQAYMQMSKNIQRRLKELIPYYFFQDAGNYKNHIPAAALLAWSAVFPSNAFSVRSNKIVEDNSDVYWNWPDKEKQILMLNNSGTRKNLKSKLQSVFERLKGTPGLEQEAEFYNPEGVDRFLTEVIDKLAGGKTTAHFRSLFFVEAEIVDGAWKAGRDMAEFIRKSKNKPTEAVKRLTEFGSGITEAFNKDFRSIYGGDAVRPLGTLLFLEAALAFLPPDVNTKPGALLDLVVLRKDADLNLSQKIRLDRLPAADILTHKQFIELGG
jgi:hypothetical protein